MTQIIGAVNFSYKSYFLSTLNLFFFQNEYFQGKLLIMKFQKQLITISLIEFNFFSIKHDFLNTSDKISLYLTTDVDYTNEKELR